MGTLKDEQAKAVKKYFLDQMDERTDKLRSAAIWDLFYGPCTAEYYKDAHDLSDWPGYASALEQLEEWADVNLTSVWVSEDCDVRTSKPEGEMGEGGLVESHGWTEYDLKSVKSIVFWKLVSDGGMN